MTVFSIDHCSTLLRISKEVVQDIHVTVLNVFDILVAALLGRNYQPEDNFTSESKSRILTKTDENGEGMRTDNTFMENGEEYHFTILSSLMSGGTQTNVYVQNLRAFRSISITHLDGNAETLHEDVISEKMELDESVVCGSSDNAQVKELSDMSLCNSFPSPASTNPIHFKSNEHLESAVINSDEGVRPSANTMAQNGFDVKEFLETFSEKFFKNSSGGSCVLQLDRRDIKKEELPFTDEINFNLKKMLDDSIMSINEQQKKINDTHLEIRRLKDQLKSQDIARKDQDSKARVVKTREQPDLLLVSKKDLSQVKNRENEIPQNDRREFNESEQLDKKCTHSTNINLINPVHETSKPTDSASGDILTEVKGNFKGGEAFTVLSSNNVHKPEQTKELSLMSQKREEKIEETDNFTKGQNRTGVKDRQDNVSSSGISNNSKRTHLNKCLGSSMPSKVDQGNSLLEEKYSSIDEIKSAEVEKSEAHGVENIPSNYKTLVLGNGNEENMDLYSSILILEDKTTSIANTSQSPSYNLLSPNADCSSLGGEEQSQKELSKNQKKKKKKKNRSKTETSESNQGNLSSTTFQSALSSKDMLPTNAEVADAFIEKNIPTSHHEMLETDCNATSPHIENDNDSTVFTNKITNSEDIDGNTNMKGETDLNVESLPLITKERNVVLKSIVSENIENRAFDELEAISGELKGKKKFEISNKTFGHLLDTEQPRFLTIESKSLMTEELDKGNLLPKKLEGNVSETEVLKLENLNKKELSKIEKQKSRILNEEKGQKSGKGSPKKSSEIENKKANKTNEKVSEIENKKANKTNEKVSEIENKKANKSNEKGPEIENKKANKSNETNSEIENKKANKSNETVPENNKANKSNEKGPEIENKKANKLNEKVSDIENDKANKSNQSNQPIKLAPKVSSEETSSKKETSIGTISNQKIIPKTEKLTANKSNYCNVNTPRISKEKRLPDCENSKTNKLDNASVNPKEIMNKKLDETTETGTLMPNKMEEEITTQNVIQIPKSCNKEIAEIEQKVPSISTSKIITKVTKPILPTKSPEEINTQNKQCVPKKWNEKISLEKEKPKLTKTNAERATSPKIIILQRPKVKFLSESEMQNQNEPKKWNTDITYIKGEASKILNIETFPIEEYPKLLKSNEVICKKEFPVRKTYAQMTSGVACVLQKSNDKTETGNLMLTKSIETTDLTSKTLRPVVGETSKLGITSVENPTCLANSNSLTSSNECKQAVMDRSTQCDKTMFFTDGQQNLFSDKPKIVRPQQTRVYYNSSLQHHEYFLVRETPCYRKYYARHYIYAASSRGRHQMRNESKRFGVQSQNEFKNRNSVQQSNERNRSSRYDATQLNSESSDVFHQNSNIPMEVEAQKSIEEVDSTSKTCDVQGSDFKLTIMRRKRPISEHLSEQGLFSESNKKLRTEDREICITWVDQMTSPEIEKIPNPRVVNLLTIPEIEPCHTKTESQSGISFHTEETSDTMSKDSTVRRLNKEFICSILRHSKTKSSIEVPSEKNALKCVIVDVKSTHYSTPQYSTNVHLIVNDEMDSKKVRKVSYTSKASNLFYGCTYNRSDPILKIRNQETCVEENSFELFPKNPPKRTKEIDMACIVLAEDEKINVKGELVDYWKYFTRSAEYDLGDSFSVFGCLFKENISFLSCNRNADETVFENETFTAHSTQSSPIARHERVQSIAKPVPQSSNCEILNLLLDSRKLKGMFCCTLMQSSPFTDSWKQLDGTGLFQEVPSASIQSLPSEAGDKNSSETVEKAPHKSSCGVDEVVNEDLSRRNEEVPHGSHHSDSEVGNESSSERNTEEHECNLSDREKGEKLDIPENTAQSSLNEIEDSSERTKQTHKRTSIYISFLKAAQQRGNYGLLLNLSKIRSLNHYVRDRYIHEPRKPKLIIESRDTVVADFASFAKNLVEGEKISLKDFDDFNVYRNRQKFLVAKNLHDC